MLKYKSQIPKSGKAYCSLSCSTSYRNKHEFNPSHHRDISGEKNPMFGKGHLIAGENNGMYCRKAEDCPNRKGGRHQRKDGYIRLNVYGKRVLEHRKVMEDAGFDTEGMVVHHKNGDKSDNSLDNLELMTQSEHIEKHREEMIVAQRKVL